jgi:hypothetical protein
MRSTYAEATARSPRARAQSAARLGLTVVLVVLAGLAVYELASFTIDYWRALHG